MAYGASYERELLMNTANEVVEGPPVSLARRCARAAAAGLATLAITFIPMEWALSSSWGSFRGCLMACPIEPRPGAGIAWAIISALLLAIPIFTGLRVARVKSRRAWAAAVALVPVLLAANAWMLFETGLFPTP